MFVLRLGDSDGCASNPEQIFKENIILQVNIWSVHDHATNKLWSIAVIVSAFFWVLQCFFTDHASVIDLSTIKDSNVKQS